MQATTVVADTVAAVTVEPQAVGEFLVCAGPTPLFGLDVVATEKTWVENVCDEDGTIWDAAAVSE